MEVACFIHVPHRLSASQARKTKMLARRNSLWVRVQRLGQRDRRCSAF